MERNNIEGFIGSKVQIVVADGKYDGIIAKIDKTEAKITLKNIELIENNEPPTKILGVLHFFGHEIEDIQFYDAEEVLKRVDNMYLVMKPFHKPKHLVGQDIPTATEIVKMGRGEETRFVGQEIDTSFYPEHTFITDIDSTFTEATDQSIWKERPLSQHLLNHLIAKVMYLFELRLNLLDKMLSEFTAGVEINLQIAKVQTEATLYRMLKNTDLLPAAFLQLNEKAASRRAKADRTSSIDPESGMRESMGRLNFSYLRWSRDGWHGRLKQKGKTVQKPKRTVMDELLDDERSSIDSNEASDTNELYE